MSLTYDRFALVDSEMFYDKVFFVRESCFLEGSDLKSNFFNVGEFFQMACLSEDVTLIVAMRSFHLVLRVLDKP